MRSVDADVLVVGGGPAGLAAAMRARQLDLSALVLEPESPPIDKACGEGLMPAAIERLRRLGVGPLEGRSFEGIRYVDARDRRCTARGDFADGCRGLGVRRTELHRALHERAGQLGVAFEAERVESVQRGERWVRAGGRCGRYLVAADGLHSDVRRMLGLERAERRRSRYGVRRHFHRPPWSSRVEVHLSGRGEAYVTPVDERTVGVALLSEGGGRFDELIEAFPILRERLRGVEPVTPARGAGPFEQHVDRRVAGRVLLVGDAAGYLDALTGEGVALAVETGCAAVEAIADGDPASYERRYRRTTRRYLGLTELLLRVTRWRQLHRPFIRLLDWAPGLFDGAVRMLGGSDGQAGPVAAPGDEATVRPGR